MDLSHRFGGESILESAGVKSGPRATLTGLLEGALKDWLSSGQFPRSVMVSAPTLTQAMAQGSLSMEHFATQRRME